MAKAFRLWQKKRGERLTGSTFVGRLGEAGFFGALFLLGLLSLVALFTNLWLNPDPRAFRIGFGFFLMLIVLASFLLIGGGGLIYSILEVGASAERRNALAQRASRLELMGDHPAPRRRHPNIPGDENITNSPGIRLAYRLPRTQSPAWPLSVAGIFCTVWSGIATVLLVAGINSLRQGRPQWLLLAFNVPFGAVGLWSIYYFFRELLLHTGIGPTSLEISDHPLFPGHQYQLFMTQAGHLQFRELSVSLVCEEEATYTQGTDIRIDTREVFREAIVECRDFRVDPRQPFEHECLFRIPADAMHSFAAKNNAIVWKLVVKGKAESWPAFERSFPVVVHPV